MCVLHACCPLPLLQQESTLQLLGGKIFRCLAVVKVCAHGFPGGAHRNFKQCAILLQVVVRQPGKMRRYLVCHQQTMEDGRVRERNQLPSEKLFAGEVVAKAVERCLIEELGCMVTPTDIDVVEGSLVVSGTPFYRHCAARSFGYLFCTRQTLPGQLEPFQALQC